MGKAKDPLLDALGKAARGLVYTSETDAPLTPFSWAATPRMTAAKVRELAGAEKGTKVEQTSLDDFLATVPEEDREQFDALARVLQEQLSGVKVFKVGDE